MNDVDLSMKPFFKRRRLYLAVTLLTTLGLVLPWFIVPGYRALSVSAAHNSNVSTLQTWALKQMRAEPELHCDLLVEVLASCKLDEETTEGIESDLADIEAHIVDDAVADLVRARKPILYDNLWLMSNPGTVDILLKRCESNDEALFTEALIYVNRKFEFYEAQRAGATLNQIHTLDEISNTTTAILDLAANSSAPPSTFIASDLVLRNMRGSSLDKRRYNAIPRTLIVEAFEPKLQQLRSSVSLECYLTLIEPGEYQPDFINFDRLFSPEFFEQLSKAPPTLLKGERQCWLIRRSATLACPKAAHPVYDWSLASPDPAIDWAEAIWSLSDQQVSVLRKSLNATSTLSSEFNAVEFGLDVRYLADHGAVRDLTDFILQENLANSFSRYDSKIDRFVSSWTADRLSLDYLNDLAEAVQPLLDNQANFKALRSVLDLIDSSSFSNDSSSLLKFKNDMFSETHFERWFRRSGISALDQHLLSTWLEFELPERRNKYLREWVTSSKDLTPLLRLKASAVISKTFRVNIEKRETKFKAFKAHKYPLRLEAIRAGHAHLFNDDGDGDGEFASFLQDKSNSRKLKLDSAFYNRLTGDQFCNFQVLTQLSWREAYQQLLKSKKSWQDTILSAVIKNKNVTSVAQLHGYYNRIITLAKAIPKSETSQFRTQLIANPDLAVGIPFLDLSNPEKTELFHQSVELNNRTFEAFAIATELGLDWPCSFDTNGDSERQLLGFLALINELIPTNDNNYLLRKAAFDQFAKIAVTNEKIGFFLLSRLPIRYLRDAESIRIENWKKLLLKHHDFEERLSHIFNEHPEYAVEYLETATKLGRNQLVNCYNQLRYCGHTAHKVIPELKHRAINFNDAKDYNQFGLLLLALTEVDRRGETAIPTLVQIAKDKSRSYLFRAFAICCLRRYYETPKTDAVLTKLIPELSGDLRVLAERSLDFCKTMRKRFATESPANDSKQ